VVIGKTSVIKMIVEMIVIRMIVKVVVIRMIVIKSHSFFLISLNQQSNI